MKEIKALYDPLNIFNPHKKTDATWDYSFKPHTRSLLVRYVASTLA
jgi:hypothetical protein